MIKSVFIALPKLPEATGFVTNTGTRIAVLTLTMVMERRVET